MSEKTYTLNRVPTFLLYDALSWMIKHGKDYATFYRSKNGIRTDLRATPDDIQEELDNRTFEQLDPTVTCSKCRKVTDGRCESQEGNVMCSPCYWQTLKYMLLDSLPQPRYILPSETKGKPTPVPTPLPVPIIIPETKEDIANRLGVPIDMLESIEYFEGLHWVNKDGDRV